MIQVLETTDPSLLPSNLPPINLLKMYPASQMQAKMTTQITFPTRTLRVFAERLEMGFEIARMELGETEGPHYLEDGTLVIPNTMRTVISMAFEMDYDLTAACPTQESDAAVQYGYSNMATTGASLARFLMGLGYNAIPCGNNTGLCIPLAVDAGLGELGRNGLLITPEYGPRVRIGKVITDLPMAYDHPISFGVKEFCDVCGKCAKACPVQAISHGEQTDKAINLSTNPGVMKWPVDGEKCFISWTREGSSCGMCIKVCPFNKPQGLIHDAARIVVHAKSGLMDRAMVQMDDVLGYGNRKPEFEFFSKR
jgi:reductive dehalogenase